MSRTRRWSPSCRALGAVPGVPGGVPARFPAHDDPSADVGVTTWDMRRVVARTHSDPARNEHTFESLVVSGRGGIPYGRRVRDGVPLI